LEGYEVEQLGLDVEVGESIDRAIVLRPKAPPPAPTAQAPVAPPPAPAPPRGHAPTGAHAPRPAPPPPPATTTAPKAKIRVLDDSESQ
jgi:hypothetical protein